jgi:NTP pyrophosphatase (non-canonical NTP hydrolase)
VNFYSDLVKLDAWIDGGTSPMYQENPLASHWGRVAKVTEEAGEAVEALIGMTGQNPRKGFTHSTSDLLNELADVAITALAAIQHFTKDESATQATVEHRMTRLVERAGL